MSACPFRCIADDAGTVEAVQHKCDPEHVAKPERPKFCRIKQGWVLKCIDIAFGWRELCSRTPFRVGPFSLGGVPYQRKISVAKHILHVR